MTPTVLVTGAAGFAGRYMCRHVRSVRPNMKIIGIDIRQNSDCQCDDFSVIDITDSEKTRAVIEKTKPGFILHLAGTFGAGDAQDIYRINVLSTTAILEAMRQMVPSSIFIGTGSAAEYGRVEEMILPVTEDNRCRPVTPYGLSKHMATQIAAYYHRVHGLCTMTVRPFQLIGKGVTDRLAPGAFARRLMEARKTGAKTISVGNLESSRDFLDIHDAVIAIWCLCEKPAPGEVFNLCSGYPIKISELLDRMIRLSGIDIEPITHPAYLKGNHEIDAIYGSYEKLYRHCGWTPHVSLPDSINSMINEKE